MVLDTRVQALSTEVGKILKNGVTNFQAVAGFNAALARRESRRCNVVWVGASLAEGFNVPDYKLSPPQQLQAILRSLYPTSGGVGGIGYFGAPTAGATFPSPTVLVGGSIDPAYVGGPESFGYAVNHNTWYTNGTGTYGFQCSPAATSVRLWFAKHTGGSATGGGYQINGGAVVTFNTYAAVNTTGYIDIAVPPSALVAFTCQASGFYFIPYGVQEFGGDETKGIQVAEAGHGGYAVWQLANMPIPATSWRDHMELLAPDLLIVSDIGANDGNVNGNNRSAATVQADLQNYINVVRAGGTNLASCAILLVTPYDYTSYDGDVTGITPNSPVSQYATAARDVARANNKVMHLDLAKVMPPTVGNPKGLYAADLVHGAADGSTYGLMAEAIADFLLPRTRTAPKSSTATGTTLLKKDFVQKSFANSAAQNTLTTIAIDPADVANGDILEYEFIVKQLNNSGSTENVTFDVVLGATTIHTGQEGAMANSATSGRIYRIRGTINVVNKANSQVCIAENTYGAYSIAGGAASNSDNLGRFGYTEPAVDMTVALNLVLKATMTLASASASVTLMSATIRRVRS